IMMTPKELGELGELDRAAPHVVPADLPEPQEDAMLEPGLRKSVTILREFAAMPEHIRAEKHIAVEFAFFRQPTELLGEDSVREIEVEHTRLEKGRAVSTGRTERLPADMVVSCIGYRSVPLPGVPFDERAGRFANDEGRILPGLYCVGWARRGPSGTIGTNKPDGFGVVERIAEDMDSGALGRGGKEGRVGFDALAEERGLDVITFQDWKKIEEAEAEAAQGGAPREKFVDVEAMIRALDAR
ncbi:MAG: pyridine nucleotide-disulfide oxidoreductase, partial [Alteraurantiacibacter sp.]